MIKCWKCANTITSTNKSKEHIIPDCIGGKGFHFLDLLCRNCNNQFGESLDSELEKQLGYIADSLNIDRDRKSKKKTIIAIRKDCLKESYSLGLQGRAQAFIHLQKYTIPIPIRANNKEVLIKRVRKKLTELKKKYPKLNIEEEIKNFTVDDNKNSLKRYITNKISEGKRIGHGGLKFMQGITKIAINFAYYHKVDLFYLKYPIIFSQLEDSNNSNFYPIAQFFYEKNTIAYSENEISNTLFLVGNPVEKTLVCFISLFSYIQVIVVLSLYYEGERIIQQYSFDFISKKKLDKAINITEGFHYNKAIIESRNINSYENQLWKQYEEVMKILEKNQKNDGD